MRLRWQISLTFMALLLSSSLILTYLLYHNLLADHEIDHTIWTETLGESLSEAVLPDVIDGKKREVTDVIKRIVKTDNDLDYIIVYGFDGSLFSSTLDEGVPSELRQMDHSKCETGEVVHVQRMQHDVRDTTYTLVEGLEAHMHLGIQNELYSRSVKKSAIAAIWVIVPILLLALFVAMYMSSGIARPISQLAESVEDFGQGKAPKKSTVVGGSKEVKKLAEKFYQMASERLRSEEEIKHINEALEKRVEQRTADLVEAKNSAEAANRAKSDFLSNMSHELRTPMNAIMGFSQLLEIDENLNSGQKESVSEILKASRHLMELINQVLDMAKIEAKGITLDSEEVDVSNIISDSVALITPLAQVRNIQIENYLPPDSSYVVVGDKLRIKQVLINLLSNAVKYNKEGGKVSIGVEPACKQGICFSIKDTGAGIPADRMDKLFSPFERLGYGDHKVEGAGIGLALSKKLMELMGGDIRVQSTSSEGSVFVLEFPYCK